MMDFEQRKSIALKMVGEFLDDFAPPRGMPDDKLVGRMTEIADAFARRMPTKGDFEASVEKVLLSIRDTHMSNSWPAQGVFVMAMPSVERVHGPSPETYMPDRVTMYSDLMNEKQGVPEHIIWGPISGKLALQAGVLEKYRAASVKAWMKAYNKSAREMMVKRYGSIVGLYFNEGQGAA